MTKFKLSILMNQYNEIWYISKLFYFFFKFSFINFASTSNLFEIIYSSLKFLIQRMNQFIVLYCFLIHLLLDNCMNLFSNS